MKMHSNEKPNYLHQSGGAWFFNINATLVPGGAAMDETTPHVEQWVSDSMPIEGEPSRDKLISAGMQARYSKDDEIALLNKKIAGESCAEYDVYRTAVKSQVDEAGYPKTT